MRIKFALHDIFYVQSDQVELILSVTNVLLYHIIQIIDRIFITDHAEKKNESTQ